MAYDSHSNNHSPLVARVTGILLRWYWLILIIAVVSGYYSFRVAQGLELSTDIVALMPHGVPSVENLKKVISKTGGYSSAMVIVRSPDPDAAVRFLAALRKQVLRLNYISSAEYEEDTSIFRRNQLLYVNEKDLEEILRRLTARINYEKKHIKFDVKDTPVSVNIRGANEKPPSLDFSDIEKKYRGSGKDKSNEKKIFRNDKGNITVMVVMPKGSTTSMKYARKVVEDLQALVKKVDPKKYNPKMTVAIGGRVASRVADFDVVMSDLTGSAAWSIGGILLIIVLFYRRFSSLLYICFPLIVAFLWTFALTKVFLGELNLITVFLVLILFGLGIDFGIHNLQRYDEIRGRGGDIREALATIVFKTGHASLLAAATTAAGFYALMWTKFRAFSEFGFIAGTGVTLAFACMYTIFPALMVLAERIGFYRPPLRFATPKTMSWWKRDISKPVLIVGLVFTVFTTIAAFSIGFEQDFGKLDTDIPRMDKLRNEVREVFPLRNDKAVLYVDNLEDVRAVVAKLEEIRRSRSPQNQTIEKVKSIYDVVPDSQEQQRRLKIIDKIHARMVEAIHLLEDFGGDSSRDEKRKKELKRLLKYAGIGELKPAQLPPGIQRIYTGVKGSKGYLVYIYNARSTAQLHNAEAFVNDIRNIKANGKVYHPATEAMVFVDMLNLMRSDARHAVGVVLVSVFLVLLIGYRSIRYSLIVMIPLIMGMSWMLGIMGAFNIKLNVINMVVLPTVLGIGIDNGIHIFQRYTEEGFDHVREVVITTGGAAFLATATTLLGFAGTLTAQNNGLKSLGLAATIGLTTCLISSLTIFPALLNRYGKRLIGKAAGEPKK